MKKTGAMELSVGTIVIIVLSMSMLILGLVLIKGLFSGATDVTDLTIDQIRSEIQNMFGNDKKIVMLPQTRDLTVKPGKPAAFAFGIKNDIQGVVDKTFSYEVIVRDVGNCGVSEETVLGWITIGKSEDNIEIPSGDFYTPKIDLNIPTGSPLCDFSYRVNVRYGDQAHAVDTMTIHVRS